jgi:hypothetical protein
MNFNFKNVFPILREAMRQKRFEGVVMKTSSEDKKRVKSTKKGATHKIGESFKPRQILAMTPAFYRHNHRGVVKIVPNYLKPHPAPRGRNVWISA